MNTIIIKNSLIIICLLLIICPSIVIGQPIRKLQYTPEGREIICVNGINRYTRSLYGTHTLFRLETSDRPVFATYDGKHNKNIQFTINGIALDKAEYCRAGYTGGKRTYTIKDNKWGNNTEVNIITLASRFEEGAIWKISVKGFKKPAVLVTTMSPTKKQKMTHNGELGIVDLSGFDADTTKEAYILTSEIRDENYLLLDNSGTLRWLGHAEGTQRFNREIIALNKIIGQVEFSTPDPYINVLGANLMAAADGL